MIDEAGLQRRAAEAGRFGAAFAAALEGDLANDPKLADFISQLQALTSATPRDAEFLPFEHPTLGFLDPALKTISGPAELVAATLSLARMLKWYQIYSGEGFAPSLCKGMLAAQVAGQAGLVQRGTLRTGLFLLAPHIHYPLHTHGADEIYFCLSGTLDLQYGHTQRPKPLTPGTFARSPSHRVHSLTTRDEPVLLLYAWIGDVDSPNLAWEKAADGRWMHAEWARQPDASWRRVRIEPVPEATLKAQV